ncbi:MAG TPA: pyridoxine 5'-phosphate synthase [Vulgatibacter sp.]|nr:pyridoxine 5'-phosphate synthase [Vulgatibacter sp.]
MPLSTCRLGVNVDHVATVRQARLAPHPDPILAAALAEQGGADQITVHLREDRRHIQDRDLRLLKETCRSVLNLEMAATDEMLAIALEVRPHTVTLVPERREELTTEGGLDVAAGKDRLRPFIRRLHEAGLVVSLFVDPDAAQVEAAREAGAERIEIHTGAYCKAEGDASRAAELRRVQESAARASGLGLGVAAGHGLDYFNVDAIASIPAIEELNIGHSIVARAVMVGMERAVRDMVERIARNRR